MNGLFSLSCISCVCTLIVWGGKQEEKVKREEDYFIWMFMFYFWTYYNVCMSWQFAAAASNHQFALVILVWNWYFQTNIIKNHPKGQLLLNYFNDADVLIAGARAWACAWTGSNGCQFHRFVFICMYFILFRYQINCPRCYLLCRLRFFFQHFRLPITIETCFLIVLKRSLSLKLN